MNHIWPSEFIADAKARPGRVIGLEVDAPAILSDCQNCGGLEVLYAYYVEGGPYKNAPGAGKVSRWFDDGWYTGELKASACPVCAGSKKNLWMERVSGLTGADLNIRIENFRVGGMFAGKEHAREIACGLLALTPAPYGFVTFWGNYGTGKTTLLKALVNSFRVAGVLSVYIRMADLLASVRDTFGDSARGAAESLIAEYRGVRVLAIDEIDRVNLTSWASETMFRLVDWRYEQQDTILTVAATNTAPELMPREYQYLASRMTGGVVVELAGADVRPSVGMRAERELMEYAP